jgi:hypothetical protein
MYLPHLFFIIIEQVNRRKLLHSLNGFSSLLPKKEIDLFKIRNVDVP